MSRKSGLHLKRVKKHNYHNLGQNIWRLFHFLAQFFFTTSKTELDYYHQKWVYELPHELPSDLRLRILGNQESIQPSNQKPNFDVFLVKNRKKSAVKHSTEIPISLLRHTGAKEMLDSLIKTIHCDTFKQTWAADPGIHKVFNSTFFT